MKDEKVAEPFREENKKIQMSKKKTAKQMKKKSFM